MNRLGYLLAMLGSCAILLLAVVLWNKEAAVLTYGPPADPAVHDRIYEGNVETGFSSYADSRILAACIYGMTGIHALANTPEYNRDYAQRCRAIADETLKHNAGVSFAWAVRAQASGVLQDFGAMNNDLLMSWRTGKFEQWIATDRNLTAESFYDKLGDEAKKANDHDLAILVISYTGIQSIARKYRDDPSFRERITQIVATLSDEDQRRFVYSVRRAVAEL